MSGDDKIVIVNDHVVDGSRREIELQRLPMRAIVKRNPNARLRPRVQQTFALGIFADGVNIGIIREAGEEFRPRFSIVAGLENERLEIVELVSVDSDVSGCSVERRS